MKLIANLFTRNETRGFGLVTDRAPRMAETRASENVLSAHFGDAASDAYDLWLSCPEGDPAAGTTVDGLSIMWQREPGGVAWGRVCFRGAVVCEALSLDASADGASGYSRRSLRARGIPRGRAAILSKLSGRPVLATFGRGPVLPHETMRQVHRMLVESLGRWDRLSRTAV